MYTEISHNMLYFSVNIYSVVLLLHLDVIEIVVLSRLGPGYLLSFRVLDDFRRVRAVVTLRPR